MNKSHLHGVVCALLVLCSKSVYANTIPIAIAGVDQDAYTGKAVRLDGSASYDPDGDPIVFWYWEFYSLPTASNSEIDNPFGDTPTFTPDLVGDYVLSLVVTDGYDYSLPDYVTISATVNQPPVAVAQADVTAGAAPLTVNFDGTASYDPEGNDLQYLWWFNDGAAFSQSVTATHTFTAPGTYDVEFRVVETNTLFDIDYITINVGTVPVPAAVWLFGSGLLGLFGIARRKKAV